jgi:hypothetical protein
LRAVRRPAPRIKEVVRKRPGNSADTALCLARHFGRSARSSLNLQTAYDLCVADIAHAKRLATCDDTLFGFESIPGFREKLAEREEATPLRKLLFQNIFVSAVIFHTII